LYFYFIFQKRQMNINITHSGVVEIKITFQEMARTKR